MMGFAGNTCGKSIIYFDLDEPWEEQETQLAFQCQETTAITQVLSAGILQAYAVYGDSDVRSEHLCYLPEDAKDLADHPEMEYFQDEAFKESLLEQCQGQTACRANMT